SDFTVDSLPPTGSIEAPGRYTNTPAPLVKAVYSDEGTGVDPASVQVFVDEIERTSLFAVSATEATGVLALHPPLAERQHTLRVHLADRAGHAIDPTASFVLDTTPPVLFLSAPANDSFINDPTPALRLGYGDGAGSGAKTQSLRLYLRKGNEAEETEIT